MNYIHTCIYHYLTMLLSRVLQIGPIFNRAYYRKDTRDHFINYDQVDIFAFDSILLLFKCILYIYYNTDNNSLS